MAGTKKRLDVILFERGLAQSRARAQSLILAGLVYASGQKLEKAGLLLDESAELEVRGKEHPFVSRGGVKLAEALKTFSIDPKGKSALDVGASTGGFTDCLLQNGAESVVALDVGKGQLDWKLRSDKRVKLVEGFNARNLSPETILDKFDISVIDVSFISLDLVLPRVASVMADGGVIIALVKPQFEAGRHEVGKGGIIRDPEIMRKAVDKIMALGESISLVPLGSVESPITGAKGNREFLSAFLKPPMDGGLFVRRKSSFPGMEISGTKLYPIVNRAEAMPSLIRAGIKLFQLRIKDMAGDALEKEVAESIRLAKEGGCAVFINDYWELAIKHGAYGVHLGQEDIVAADLDAIQTAGLRLGISTHDHIESAIARAQRPSYVAFGPIFHTKLKAMRFPPQGVERLKLWKKTVPHPIVAIGGITLENAAEVMEAKPDFLAVVGDIMNSADPEGRARDWIKFLGGSR